MSSFAGRMREYPTVSLDRFDRENLHAQAYFLSHCHKGDLIFRFYLRFYRDTSLTPGSSLRVAKETYCTLGTSGWRWETRPEWSIFTLAAGEEVCLKGISELIGNWISQSSYHVVWLNCKAAYGYEYLFTNLGDEFGTQIHVNSLAMFKKMPEILSYVTTDRRSQIHACRHPKKWLLCIYPVIFLIPVYFQIKDFLSYLQPVNILPSVIPIGRTLAEVSQMLRLMCRNQPDGAAFIYKPLGVLKRRRVQRLTYDSGSDDELFEGLDLAPVRKKMSLNQEPENEPLSDSQNSQSHSCCSVAATTPSRETGSQTPDLFSDEDQTPDNVETFSLTLSASLSNHSSQNLEDTLILHPQTQNTKTDCVQSELEELPASQASSDFDIPSTPESKVPQPDDLLQLYRKLASGEEVVIRGGGQVVHEGD
ncbi:hypothetical protein XENOCAPTIV_008541 [Xenoophorus captivus]|uniref:Uncharacterized protein n=1 Tax=Xenoophorus captivus TaxID=1517983 RepID=A0ABV0RGQ3_9TELE